MNPSIVKPFPDSVQRLGQCCPHIDLNAMPLPSATNAEKFKKLLNSASNPKMAYENFLYTDPLMVIKVTNLKLKIKSLYPAEPESRAFQLESFTEENLLLRDHILVRSRLDLPFIIF